MEYNVEFVKVSELKPYENNAKKHDEAQIDQIINSIKQFGWRQNLVIDDNNVVIIGHGRLKAAEKMGLEVVPCVRASDLTEDQIKALRIADNKIAEHSSWDNDLLGEELKALADAVDMTDLGFGDFELTILTGDYEPEPYTADETDGYNDSAREDDLLARKRVIISYLPEQEDMMKKLLGVEEVKKIVYDITELVK